MVQDGRGEDGRVVVGVKEEAGEEEKEDGGEAEIQELVSNGRADALTLALLLDMRKKDNMDQCRGGGEKEVKLSGGEAAVRW